MNRRLATALIAGTVAVVGALIAVVPMHVSLGAGTLRCGTVLAPDTATEIGTLCSEARPTYVRSTAIIAAALLAISVAPLLRRHWKGFAAGIVVCWIVTAAAAITWSAAMQEYSPRHAIFDL